MTASKKEPISSEKLEQISGGAKKFTENDSFLQGVLPVTPDAIAQAEPGAEKKIESSSIL